MPSPFHWSMTFSSWDRLVFTLTVCRAKFLCGIRPARWFGSRVLPLLGATVLLCLVRAYVYDWMSVWWLGTGLVLLLDAWLIATIIFVADERDY